jgi:hypothetical protein
MVLAAFLAGIVVGIGLAVGSAVLFIRMAEQVGED